MTKNERLHLIAAAIDNLEIRSMSLEAGISNPVILRQYDITQGKIEAYRSCFHMLNDSTVSIKIDCQ